MVERMNEVYLLISIKILNWLFRCTPVGTDSWTCQCTAGFTGMNCDTAATGTRHISFVFVKNYTFFHLVNSCLQGTTTSCYNGGS